MRRIIAPLLALTLAASSAQAAKSLGSTSSQFNQIYPYATAAQDRENFVSRMLDGSASTYYNFTAWQSKSSDEIPEVSFYFGGGTLSSIWMRIGNQTTSADYAEHARPKRMRLRVWTGNTYEDTEYLTDDIYDPYTLNDGWNSGYQLFALPRTYYGVTAVDMYVTGWYKGTKDTYDVCISDIRFLGEGGYTPGIAFGWEPGTNNGQGGYDTFGETGGATNGYDTFGETGSESNNAFLTWANSTSTTTTSTSKGSDVINGSGNSSSAKGSDVINGSGNSSAKGSDVIGSDGGKGLSDKERFYMENYGSEGKGYFDGGTATASGYFQYAYVPAKLNQKMATRSGPSTNYSEQGTYFSKGTEVTVLSAAYDNRNGIWWAQVEFSYKGMMRRAYTGFKRLNINPADVVAEEEPIGTYVIASSVTPLYGPGKSFDAYSLKLASGTKGSVYAFENDYAQFEYFDSAKNVYRRVWVPTSKLK